MPETRTRTDGPTVALVVLLVIVGLTLASPFGWSFLLPLLGDALAAVWTFLVTVCTAALDGVLAALDSLTGILAG